MSDLTLLESHGPNPDLDLDPACSRISISPGRFRRRPSLPHSTTPIPCTGGIDTARLVSP